MTRTIVSRDGTRVGFSVGGRGPPLVLVHGTTANRTRWSAVLGPLEERFTVYAMDRRGRGVSGDAGAYAIEREVEDVAAVVEAVGDRVDVIGHSFGALCALEAALLTRSIRRLVLYEPPLDLEEILSPAMAQRLEALLGAGDREGVLTTFLRDAAGMSTAELEAVKALPSWSDRVAAAHTVLREMRASYVFRPERFATLRTPTLLLRGGESAPTFRKAIETLHAALPWSGVAVMPGQGHTAMNTAPELFVREVLRFLVDLA